MYEMTECQKMAWEALQSSQNVFVTGSAGTGKSYLIQEYLRVKNTKEYPVVASTGSAAIIINGRTFHSFFGLGMREGSVDEIVKKAVKSRQIKKRLNEASCVVIDEISMLSGHTLDVASEVAKRVRASSSPWGGLRIIAVGDFAQLPPVAFGNEKKDWAFLHPIWSETQFKTVQLESVLRTKEKELLSVLHSVREGIISDSVRSFLNSKISEQDYEFEGTRLFAHRRSADMYNKQRLQSLPSKEYVFHTEYEGNAYAIEKIKKNIPIPDTLHLKKHALVMIRKNDTKFPYRYINGTLGTIIEIDTTHVLLRLMNGKDIEIEKQHFSFLDGNGEEQSTAYNFPLSLAWATTIHKAQGATIDRVMVDLSQLWESGHAYVALSRVPSEEGLFIEKLTEQSIKVDTDVQKFYAGV